MRPNGSVLTVDPKLAGFVADVTQRTQKTQENLKEINRGKSLGTLCNTSVEKAIKNTIPSAYGTRHRKIFEFARYLKSMPQYYDADPVQLKDFVKKWHKQALPKIRTKELEETWLDFLLGWKKVRSLVGEGPMAKIFERAKQVKPPKIALEKFPDNQPLQLFVALCRELQSEVGEEPFFLECRAGGRYMEVSHTTINRWFMLLCFEKIVKLVQKGGFVKVKGPNGKERKERKASTYKYLYEL